MPSVAAVPRQFNASGIPSRRRQSSRRPLHWIQIAEVGPGRRGRDMKSSTALWLRISSASRISLPGYSAAARVQPFSFDFRVRLVARTRKPPPLASQFRHACAGADECSQLSRISRRILDRSAVAMRQAMRRVRWQRYRDGGDRVSTSEPSDSAARSASQTPSAHCGNRCRATSNASGLADAARPDQCDEPMRLEQ